MRLLALLACAAVTGRASATQLAVHVSAGARYSGTLVHDSIVTPFDLRPGIAPVLSVTAGLAPHRGWSGEALIDYSWSTLSRHEADGTSQELYGLGALLFGVALRRQLPAGLGVRLIAGGLTYFPAEESGVFQDGADVFPLLGLGVDFSPLFASWLSLEARADAHSFITQSLREVGFTERRFVPRVAVVVRADISRLW